HVHAMQQRLDEPELGPDEMLAALHRGVRSFSFHHPATTEIYTLSLHDALPLSRLGARLPPPERQAQRRLHRRGRHGPQRREGHGDRKSTRLNSSHVKISYAVFCLKKKKKNAHEAGRDEPTYCGRDPGGAYASHA